MDLTLKSLISIMLRTDYNSVDAMRELLELHSFASLITMET